MLSSGVAMDMVYVCLDICCSRFLTIDMIINVGNVGLKQTVEQLNYTKLYQIAC